jgi:transcriptional regulator with XRE-family HTH domain
VSSQAPSSSASIFGQNIRKARDEKGMTQRELAAKLDTDAVLVSKWERGIHRPNDENVFALVRHLGHDIAWFYTEHYQERAA